TRFISHGSSCRRTLAASATLLPSSINAWSRWPRSENFASSEKCGEGGRQAGQGGHAVHRGIKNQFGPLCRTGVFERLGFEAAGDDEIRSFFDDREWRAGGLEGTDPGWSVEFILHVCVTVARAAHESGGAEDVTVREGSDDFF